MIDRHTGEVKDVVQMAWNSHTYQPYPKPCGRKECWHCGLKAAQALAGAVFLAEPTHRIMLTLVGEDCSEINDRMRRFSDHVRKLAPSYRHAWAAEANPNGTGNHVHGFFHLGSASAVEVEEAINAARERTGFGREWGVDSVFASSPTYFGYPMNSMLDPNAAMVFLDLNGRPGHRKLLHASRNGFWRRGRDGAILTQRQAVAIAGENYWEWLGQPRLVVAS